MKQAFFVLGPESSGTRLFTRLLIAAGCQGDAGHKQAFDSGFKHGGERIVFRRSLPHNKQWPDVSGLISDMKARDYKVEAVVIARDWKATAHSQVAGRHTRKLEDAYRQIRQAYHEIFFHLDISGTSYVMASYDALVAQPVRYKEWLLEFIGLPADNLQVEIYDGNIKWYG